MWYRVHLLLYNVHKRSLFRSDLYDRIVHSASVCQIYGTKWRFFRKANYISFLLKRTPTTGSPHCWRILRWPRCLVNFTTRKLNVTMVTMVTDHHCLFLFRLLSIRGGVCRRRCADVVQMLYKCFVFTGTNTIRFYLFESEIWVLIVSELFGICI